MSCEHWEMEISALIDSSLEPNRAAEVRAHLAVCSRCRAFHREWERWHEILRQPDLQLEPPARIWNRIAVELETRSQPALPVNSLWRRIPQSRSYLAMAAVLILVSLLSLVVWQWTGNSRTEQVLAELESYSLHREGNPFYSEEFQNNPFFEYQQNREANPFGSLRSVK